MRQRHERRKQLDWRCLSAGDTQPGRRNRDIQLCPSRLVSGPERWEEEGKQGAGPPRT